jgi:hypothetical protein
MPPRTQIGPARSCLARLFAVSFGFLLGAVATARGADFEPFPREFTAPSSGITGMATSLNGDRFEILPNVSAGMGQIEKLAADGQSIVTFLPPGFDPVSIACLGTSQVAVLGTPDRGNGFTPCLVYNSSTLGMTRAPLLIAPLPMPNPWESETLRGYGRSVVSSTDSLIYVVTEKAYVQVFEPLTGNEVRSFYAGRPDTLESTPYGNFLRDTYAVCAASMPNGDICVAHTHWVWIDWIAYDWYWIQVVSNQGARVDSIDFGKLPTRAICSDRSGDLFVAIADTSLGRSLLYVLTPSGEVRHCQNLEAAPPSPQDVQTATAPPLSATAITCDDECRVWIAADSSSGPVKVMWRSDGDQDGVCDCWERDGFQVGAGNPNWKPRDANPRHGNIYLQVAGMQGVSPTTADLEALRDTFATMPSDSLRWPNPDNALGITFTYERTHTDVAAVAWDSTYRTQFLALKSAYFANDSGPEQKPFRQRIFRFCFAAKLMPDSSSGESSINGQNIITAIGSLLPSSQPRRDMMRGTLLHELGHSIGLLHGGSDTVNYKPNYKSVMNYLWQVPLPPIHGYWALDYSHQARPTLNYLHLDEANGFGGQSRDSTLIGDVRLIGAGPYCPARLIAYANGYALQVVPDGGPVDLNRNCNSTDTNISRKIHARSTPTAIIPTTLLGANDLRFIDLRIKRGFGSEYGVEVLPETNAAEMAMGASLTLDCDGDGISNWDEIAAGAPDVDCNYVPDSCEPARLDIAWPAGNLCPAGDGDSILVNVRAGGVCAFKSSNWRSAIFAVREAGTDTALRLWRSTTSGWAPSDTVWATAYDSVTGRGCITIHRMSGCGLLRLGVWVAGVSLGNLGPMTVASLDRDAHSMGTVDQFDQALWSAAPVNLKTGPCYDCDGNGVVEAADLNLITGHRGHSLPRHLLYPNGGEHLTWATPTEIRWNCGYGDSAMVTLSLLRNSQPGVSRFIIRDSPDNGLFNWSTITTDGPASDYRVRVVHTSGANTGLTSAGADSSDGTFAIDPQGGGCPVVDIWTASGWLEENSILGRSLTGATGLDAYRMMWTSGTDSAIRIRVRENERETTDLDQVRLVAIDHRQELVAYPSGERVILGTPVPPGRVTTASGQDITLAVSGGGPGFLAHAGDTLLVENKAGAPSGSRTRFSSLGTMPFEMSDGGGKNGFVYSPGAQPNTAQSIDALVLSTTGVLIQVPDSGGGWATRAHYYPREHPCDALFDSVRAGKVRLVFLDSHHIQFLGTVMEAPDSLEASKLTLQSGIHSRLGDVMQAILTAGSVTTTISPGDTLSLTFANPPLRSDRTREYFLLSRGVYTSNLPANSGPEIPPNTLRLYPSHPNPANGATTVKFDLPSISAVRLEVFDVLGRHVRTLAQGTYPAGSHVAVWDRLQTNGRPVPLGVYLCRLQAGQLRGQIKIVVVAR